MTFGLGQFTLQIPPWDRRSHAQLYADTLELAALAEDAGFSSFWLAEHHGSQDGYIPSLLPFLAAVAARTRTLELGTAVLLAPLHDPLRVAEDAAVVDNIAGGRLNLGLGLGWVPAEYRMFGVDMAGRGKRLDEFVAVLRRAWTGDPFSHDGRYYRIDEAAVTPRPARPIPIWLGGNDERALRRSAALGDGYFPPSVVAVDDLVARAEQLLALRRELGVEGPYRYGAFVTVGIGKDADEGWEAVRDGLLHLRGTYMTWGQGGRDLTGARDAAAAFEEHVRAGIVVGSPAEVAERLRPVLDGLRALPFDDVFLSVILAPPGTPFDTARRQIERFAGEVMPALR